MDVNREYYRVRSYPEHTHKREARNNHHHTRKVNTMIRCSVCGRAVFAGESKMKRMCAWCDARIREIARDKLKELYVLEERMKKIMEEKEQ